MNQSEKDRQADAAAGVVSWARAWVSTSVDIPLEAKCDVGDLASVMQCASEVQVLDSEIRYLEARKRALELYVGNATAPKEPVLELNPVMAAFHAARRGM